MEARVWLCISKISPRSENYLLAVSSSRVFHNLPRINEQLVFTGREERFRVRQIEHPSAPAGSPGIHFPRIIARTRVDGLTKEDMERRVKCWVEGGWSVELAVVEGYNILLAGRDGRVITPQRSVPAGCSLPFYRVLDGDISRKEQ